MSAPFVGRADELRALRTLISGARRGGAPTAASHHRRAGDREVEAAPRIPSRSSS